MRRVKRSHLRSGGSDSLALFGGQHDFDLLAVARGSVCYEQIGSQRETASDSSSNERP